MVGTHEKERKQCMEEQGIFIERILSNENMNRAYKQVKKNKGAAGIDGMECADLLSHLKVIFDFIIQHFIIDEPYTAKRFGKQCFLFPVRIYPEFICFVCHKTCPFCGFFLPVTQYIF